MAIADFGVNADAVVRHHFPNFPGFSTASNPTATTVGEKIVDAASDLAGKLRLKNLDPSAINAVSTTEAYAWCAQTLRLDVALRLWGVITGQNAPADFVRMLKERFDSLEENGAIAVGDGATASTSASEPEGPFTHISEHNLTTADTTLMSTAEPPFRKDDEL